MAAAAQMKIKSYLEKHKIGNLFEVFLELKFNYCLIIYILLSIQF